MLKLGIAFLARLVALAVVIETGNSEPRSVSTGLTRLGIERGNKRVLFGKRSTIALQIILGDNMLVHPETQALVANELDNTHSLIDSCILPFGATQFVLEDQHASCSYPYSLLQLYIISMIDARSIHETSEHLPHREAN